MDSLNIKKTIILGHHVSAQIAVEIAVTHPERVESLNLESDSNIVLDAGVRGARAVGGT